ncbi:hypothetical protein [Acidovorax sp.]|uniref:hypothetical protein n=1 Tax=Acidovorax sp. TaxID=1872122 RepID=UPI003D07644A
MRAVGKPKKRSTKVTAVPEGLQIEDEEKFYKDIRTALTTSLDAGFLAQTTKQIGQRQLVYIRQPSSPTVQGREGQLPALPLFIDDRQSAWLVVEIESEYGKPLMLKHVSLKLWQGTTAEAAHLCFRAEWDMRDTESSHAQPHWNVHAPRGMSSELAPEVDFKSFSGLEQRKEISSFAEFEQAEVAGAVELAPTVVPVYGLSMEQMHKFHFAMAANWHMSNGKASPSVNTTDDVVTWISSCALYIKRQFAFVMGV